MSKDNVEKLRQGLVLDAALDRGLTGLWSSHSSVGPGPDSFQLAIAIERAWEERFKGRPVVTLCPYVVDEEGVLVPSHQGLQTFKRA